LRKDWKGGGFDRIMFKYGFNNTSGNRTNHYQSIRLSILAGIEQKSTGSRDETKILQGGQNFLGLPLPDQSIFMR
jgi:hypothetical protein